MGWRLSQILTAPGVMEWVDFLTWMLFVLSAVVAIHERGSANQQNAERYVTYRPRNPAHTDPCDGAHAGELF